MIGILKNCAPKIAIILLTVASGIVKAVEVEIVVTGVLTDISGGSDSYGIAGASAQFVVTYDTASANSGSGTTPGFGTYAIYDALTADITINGELVSIDTSGFLSVSNNYISGDTDTLGTAAGIALDGSFAGLIMGDFTFELGPNFYAGNADPTLAPLENSDINTIFAPIFEEDFTFDPQYQFDVIDFSVTTMGGTPSANVPLPTFALAGLSILLGTIGLTVFRRQS